MKTNKVLMNEELYKSGKKAYKGSVLATYGSTFHKTITIQPQISNGRKILMDKDDQLDYLCQGLKKGQIGARKSDIAIEGKTSIVSEVVSECDSLETARKLTMSKDIVEELNNSLTYKLKNGEEWTLSDILEWKSTIQDINSEIRNKIEEVKKIHNHKKGTKMSNELLVQISELMTGYYVVTGFDVVITISNKHVINLTDDYVICSDEKKLDSLKEEANYNKSSNRLIAKERPVKLVIPVQTVEHIKIIKQILSRYMDNLFKGQNFEYVCSDTFNPEGIDIDYARSVDRARSTN